MRRRRSFRLRRAFTLIELMVVVGIIGLMAAMGLPSMIKALQKEGMRKALSDMQDVCFSARQQAIMSKHTTSVIFFPQQGKFGLEGASAGAESPAASPGAGKVTTATLPDNIHFAMLDIYHRDYAESDWARVTFYPDGTCDEAVIVLIGRGETKKISLDYATGAPVITDVDQ
jgi:prepilin-type N-terminal cleavage/methylation domain-containing protein